MSGVLNCAILAVFIVEYCTHLLVSLQDCPTLFLMSEQDLNSSLAAVLSSVLFSAGAGKLPGTGSMC